MKKFFKFIFVMLIFFIFSANYTVSNGTEFSADSLNITSNCVLLVEKKTGNILYEKNAYQRMSPASTTKMLTAIVVLEKGYLNEKVTVSQSALSQVPSSYTTAELKAR